MNLPPIALEFLRRHDAAKSGPTADAATLSALLTERKYPRHAAVLAFEASYGGLELPSPDGPSLKVGAYAFHLPSRYNGAERHLVPVMFAIDDIVYSLDEQGRGWACATMVEGVSRPTASDGRQLVTQALLWRALGELPKSYDFKEGAYGEEVARALGLEMIADASSAHERWWGGLDRLVVEIERGNGYEGPMTFVAR